MERLTKAQIMALTPEQINKMASSDIKQLRRIVSDLQAINKKKLYVGSLKSFTANEITLETDKGEVTIERNLISKATKYIDF